MHSWSLKFSSYIPIFIQSDRISSQHLIFWQSITNCPYSMLFKLKSCRAFAAFVGLFPLVVQVMAAPPKVGDILFHNALADNLTMMRTFGREDSRLTKAVLDICSSCTMSIHTLILSPSKARCPQSCTRTQCILISKQRMRTSKSTMHIKIWLSSTNSMRRFFARLLPSTPRGCKETQEES